MQVMKDINIEEIESLIDFAINRGEINELH